MKYQCFNNFKKQPQTRGDYWKGTEFNEHLQLTFYQTSYLYLLRQYPPPHKLLEAGCGIGRWIIPLLKENYDVIGIEIEWEALNTILQNHPADNLKLVQGNILKMGFPDKTFDIVLSLGVLEHFEDPVIQKNAIREHMRVLKDSGIFLVTVPHISIVRLLIHLPFLKLVSLLHFFKKKKHYFTEYRYNKSAFKRILENCNLKVIDFVYDDLFEPYNFGLTIDYPIKKFFLHKDIQFKANQLGNVLFKFLWNIHPKLVSGGIGFVCQKINK